MTNDDDFESDNYVPPSVSAEENRLPVRPLDEYFDPDTISHWSITMAVAWITWKSIDVVRQEWDNYRSNCADWVFETNPSALAEVGQLAIKSWAIDEPAPHNPNLDRRLRDGSWKLREQRPSGWDALEISTISSGLDSVAPKKSLWLFAGEGKLKATAIECESERAFGGNLIEIPSGHWPRLRARDESSGKAMLLGPDRVYRDVQFNRLDVKELWPKLSPAQVEQALATPEPAKARRNNNDRGRPQEYRWEEIKEFALGLVSKFGVPGPENKKLPRREDLVKAIQQEWAKRDIHLADSSVRRYLGKWLSEIRS